MALAAAMAIGLGAMTIVIAQHDMVAKARAEQKNAETDLPRKLQTDRPVTLAANQTGEAGSIWIVFRGLVTPDQVRIDVTIPDLDPFYAYPHTIDMATAEKGFTMAGHGFRLLSASKTGIRIKWDGPSLG